MVNDVILNKTAALERCIDRAKEEYRLAGADLSTNLSHQDALILNVLRACETAIDLAMHISRSDDWGCPKAVEIALPYWKPPAYSRRTYLRISSAWWALEMLLFTNTKSWIWKCFITLSRSG